MSFPKAARSKKTFDKRFLRELQLLLMSDFVVKQTKRMLQLLDRNEVRVVLKTQPLRNKCVQTST